MRFVPQVGHHATQRRWKGITRRAVAFVPSALRYHVIYRRYRLMRLRRVLIPRHLRSQYADNGDMVSLPCVRR